MKSEHCLIQAFCNRMFIILSLMALGMGVGCMLRRRGRSVDTCCGDCRVGDRGESGRSLRL